MSFKSGATAGRILKGGLVSLPRSGHYHCTVRDTTTAPNGTVPLFRARCTTTPRAEGTSHSERGLSAHSLEWYLHTEVV